MKYLQPHGRFRARIASYVPGRLRIRLQPKGEESHSMGRLKGQLSASDGVQAVTLNQRAGSVTVHYDGKRHAISEMLELLRDLGVVFEELSGAPWNEPPACPGCEDRPSALVRTVDGLNARVPRIARLGLDLKTAIPLAFAGAGLWSFARQGLVKTSPGWLLLRVALEVFVKLNPARH